MPLEKIPGKCIYDREHESPRMARAIRQGLRPLRTRPRMPVVAYVCTASIDVTVVGDVNWRNG